MNRISVVLASLLMAACATTPKTDTQALSQTKNLSAAVNPNADALSAEELESRRLAAEKAQIQALLKQSVYFDFDKFSVKPEFQTTLQKQAEFIKSHNDDVVTLQGNADERGSTEYNLALGDRRASSVKKSLGMLGVSEKQIKTISLSDEKPRLLCHEEKCWQENRRVDFVHQP